MLITIRVKYHSDRNGAGKLRANGRGVTAARAQATVEYPHHLSSSLKYWEAAGVLADRLERKNDWNLRLIRRSSADSCVAGESWEDFHFEVFDHTVRYFRNGEAVKYDQLPAGN